jgi:uncharacterized protein HemX
MYRRLTNKSAIAESVHLLTRRLVGLSKGDRQGKTRKGKIIGGVVGGVCAIIIAVWIYMCVRQRKKQNARELASRQSIEDDNIRRGKAKKQLQELEEEQAEKERMHEVRMERGQTEKKPIE